MRTIRCPVCDIPLCARIKDPWEIIRALAAAHLRRCPKGSWDRQEIGTIAIQVADAAAYEVETKR